MRFEGDYIVFSSGNRVNANGGPVGIYREAGGRIGPELLYGCDGAIGDIGGGKLSQQDRLELADYMVELWRQFRRESRPAVTGEPAGLHESVKRDALAAITAISRALRADQQRLLAASVQKTHDIEPDAQTGAPRKSGVVTYVVEATVAERLDDRPRADPLWHVDGGIEPEAYLFECEDVAQLRTIANRLGDERTLTHDQRRDLMNALCVVIGRAQDYRE
jgi:hypothetical protein